MSVAPGDFDAGSMQLQAFQERALGQADWSLLQDWPLLDEFPAPTFFLGKTHSLLQLSGSIMKEESLLASLVIQSEPVSLTT